MRLRNLTFTLVLMAAFATGLTYAQKVNPPRIIHGPYLQAPTEEGITVVWFTDKKCTSSVEIWKEDEPSRIITNSRHGLIEAFRTAHKVTIRGLAPGERYHYRAVSREILTFEPYEVVYGQTVKSPVFSFLTLDAKKNRVSFAVFNDQHEKAERLRPILGRCLDEGLDFVFLNGDMLNHVGDETQIFKGMIDPLVRTFASRIPFFLIRGNHETRGALARNLPEYIHLPQGRFYYSFCQGPVFFILLDSGEDKPDDNQYYFGLADFDSYREQQASWLREQIESDAFRKARFRIVLVHMPLYGGNNWHGEEVNRRLWGDLLNRAGVDLMICGHTHRYAFHKPGDFNNSYPLLISSPQTGIMVSASNVELVVTVRTPEGEILNEFSFEERK